MRHLTYKVRLWITVGVLLAALVGVAAFSIRSTKVIYQDLIANIYDEAFVAQSLILNADRDLYQALVARQALLTLEQTPTEFEKHLKDFRENVEQVRDRAGKAKSILETNRSEWEQYRLEKGTQSVFQLFGELEKDLPEWGRDSERFIEQIHSGAVTPGSIREIESPLFKRVRGALNDIGEILDEGAEASAETNRALMERATRIIWVVVALAALGGFFFSFVMIRQLLGSVRRILATAEAGRQGDLTLFTELSGPDELAQIGTSLDSMLRAQNDVILQLQSEAEATARRAESLAALSEETVASMEEIRGSIDQMMHLSENSSAALEQTNAGVEEVASTASTSAHAATDGAEAAARTADASENSVARVKDVVEEIRSIGVKSREIVEGMNRMGESVASITGFVATIKNIADQTNLLALNAAIEAARAGEAGRGFAVVAEEVRKLAEESNSAAKEVETLIASLQNDTASTLDVTTRAGAVMRETVAAAQVAQRELGSVLEQISRVSDVMQNIAAAAQEQAASAQEMSSGIDQVTRGTLEVVEAMVGIGNSTGETAKASEKVAEESQRLAGGAEHLRTLLDQFRVEKEEERHARSGSELRPL